MSEIDRDSWNRSLRALFGEAMFASTGARRHEDWRLDALDIMRLRTRDPRGWPVMTLSPGGSSYREVDGPFLLVTAAHFDHVLPVSRRGATEVLATLQGEWFRPDDIPDFAERKEELLSHAQRILSRFGENAACFTNAAAVKGDPDADMLNREGIHEGLTEYTADCGVIAVSDTEVGVFWAFWED
ncbi:hypothetical protein ABZ023_15745 [Streptomyces sp. NPDC006367]|uniref:hypothetical protein n=1 Tax=unclassified Streptomyces TaxID=2593676 RepID=UPI0033A606FE